VKRQETKVEQVEVEKKRLKAEASAAVSGWPDRKAFLQTGARPANL